MISPYCVCVCVVCVCVIVPRTAKKPVLTAEREVAPPPAPVSHSSKQRLMEDTEDWHPRTGTSQSRSFRILAQITGTENGTLTSLLLLLLLCPAM